MSSASLRVPLLIATSSAALALSFPPFSFWPAAYVFAAPLLYLSRRVDGFRAAAASFAAGLLGYGVILYWIFPTVAAHTGSRVQAALALLLLAAYPSAYLAAFVGLSGLISAKLSSRRSPAAVIAAIVAVPSLWVSLEYVRSLAFTGFSWAIAGYSQWNFLPALWVAPYAGVFGVSFMIMLANVVVVAWLRGETGAPRKVASVALILWLAAGILIAAVRRNEPVSSSPDETVTVGVIQPNVDQEKKWDFRYFAETKQKISRLVVAASASSPDLVLWPETSLTEILAANSLPPLWMRELSAASRVPNVAGALFEDGGSLYNAAVVINPDGAIAAAHKKTHLVPFGEYVPMRRLLEPHFGVFNNMGDLQKARGHTVLNIGTKKISAIICSENLYGDITRRFAANGAEVFFVITNDAWYGRTPAAFQHFTFNVLRAVENSRWIVQSANTGVSGVISADGRIVVKTPIFEDDSFAVSVPLVGRRTFYTRYGDLFAIICSLFATTAVIASVAVRIRKEGANDK